MSFDALRNPDAQRELVATVFADAGWEAPGMVNAMRDADDLFGTTRRPSPLTNGTYASS